MTNPARIRWQPKGWGFDYSALCVNIKKDIAERVRYSIRGNPVKLPKRLYLEVKYLYQRAFRGWADCDVWSLDTSMLGYLGGAIHQLGQNPSGAPHGYPNKYTKGLDWGDTDFDQWSKDLQHHGKVLMAYTTSKFEFKEYSEEVKALEDTRESLQWVVDWFPSLWD